MLFEVFEHPGEVFGASIEIGTQRYDVTARVATGDERQRIWEAQKEAFPTFAEYETKTGGREIPVVVLDTR